LSVLKKIIPKEEFREIEINLKTKEYFQFVKSLIKYHYDRAYKKTRAENESNIYKEIYLDIKHPKLYKKVRRYYEGLQYINLNGEDPDADYNAVIECITEDLKL